MPLIKPRPRGKQFERLITRLEQENHEALHVSGRFLGEPVEYVLNQLTDTLLTTDKEFVTWRAEHPDLACWGLGSQARSAASKHARGEGGAMPDRGAVARAPRSAGTGLRKPG